MYLYRHPRPSCSADIVLFRKADRQYQVLLIKRARNPFQGWYALPGGFVGRWETLEDAASRELEEETGLREIPLVQIQTFSDPERDPRGRVISTAFGALIDDPNLDDLTAGDDASQAAWFDLPGLPPLAFDHQSIIASAMLKLGLDLSPIK